MEPNGCQLCDANLEFRQDMAKSFVSNDDSSSSCVALKHSIQARILLENSDEPPQGADGKKLKNTGKLLPAHIKEPTTFFVDPSHQHHVYGSYFYHLIAGFHALKNQL